MAVAETEQNLEWEARKRVPAAVVAGLGALAIMGGLLWRYSALANPPHAGLLESIARLPQPGPIGRLPSLRTPTYEFYDAHATSVLVASIVSGIGSLLLAAALTYLAVAVRHRRPGFPAFALFLPAVGGIAQALSTIIATIATNNAINEFLAGSRTIDAADEVGSGGLAAAAQILSIGSLFTAIAIVLIAMNAMRVGLLTKVMSVVGFFCAALLVIQLLFAPLLLAFWLAALAVLFAGAWPGGQPPAWRTGRAEPWPTAAQLREQRQAAYAQRRGQAVPEPGAEDVEPAAADTGAEPSAVAAPSTRQKKRKRRR